MTLSSHKGKWDVSKAAHLLRRTLYGPSPDMMIRASESGMERVVDMLLRDIDIPPGWAEENM
ncbi:MAG TPA: hypothetical protein PKC30_06420 [Saprospiraceae bacterium]|nr:hypothetical protein [Saprospiraceae bacterium]